VVWHQPLLLHLLRIDVILRIIDEEAESMMTIMAMTMTAKIC
jgi:hypothetical protein